MSISLSSLLPHFTCTVVQARNLSIILDSRLFNFGFPLLRPHIKSITGPHFYFYVFFIYLWFSSFPLPVLRLTTPRPFCSLNGSSDFLAGLPAFTCPFCNLFSILQANWSFYNENLGRPLLSYPLIVSHVSSVNLTTFTWLIKQWIRLLHLGSEVSSLGILPKYEFTHILYSTTFLSATLVFSLNGLLPYFHFTNYGLVFKSLCTHCFLQGVFTHFPNLDKLPTQVLL